ncbi:hypothetical protein PHYPSEUDO_005583 [Phytophthora pseudosyringae]|uniref:Uncharacterized protein n=1 Tax=Phytophthora pseudosyringae TaxID=221518 RepID=A0A8T1WB33_9STRA|nr:hypothetical protein PHYPSEUDO_005583 [Phytophthora pseudosyringae]
MPSKRIKAPLSAMTPPTLPSLPLSVFPLVMEFAVYGYSQALLPSTRSPPAETLKDVAMVSKSWLHPVKHLMTQYSQETMEIQVKIGVKEEVDKIQSDISARGAAVRDLRVCIGKEKEYSSGAREFLLLTKQTEEVARKSCFQLESLVLPRKPKLKELEKGEKIETVLKELYLALEQMHLKGSRGGLRQLTVPTRNAAERHRSSKEFLENVAMYCPNVEHLDGSEYAFHSYEGVRCEDKWMISLDTWEKFNKTCTSLREFHWSPVPFADPFFCDFGANPKPQLETLSITANLLWSWKEYLQSCGDATAVAIKDCHGRRAKDVATIFDACPALKNLTVEIDLQKYTDSAARHFKIDILGDEFWAGVATNCPRLESLAELKNLYSVESNAAVMCTGDGIFDYMHRVLELNCYSKEWRMLDLRIGGPQNGISGVPVFYSVLVALLRRLAEVSEKDFGAAANKQKFKVFLSNPYHSRVSKQWSSIYMHEELRPLMYRVKEMHPSLEDEYYSENDPSDHMPPALMNLFNEILGYNSQGEGSDSVSDENDGDDGEGQDEVDDFWVF